MGYIHIFMLEVHLSVSTPISSNEKKQQIPHPFRCSYPVDLNPRPEPTCHTPPEKLYIQYAERTSATDHRFDARA